MSHYIQYYDDQTGGGRGVKNVYEGAAYQRGSGIGSFLGSIFRSIIPHIVKGAKAVGKEAVRTGLNVLDDVGNNNANLKESLKTHLRQSGKNLKRKAEEKISQMMRGKGYISTSRKRGRQSKNRRTSAHRKNTKKRSSSGVSRKRTFKRQVRRKTKSRVRSVADIFGPH